MTFLKPKIYGNWKPEKNPNKPRVDKRAEWPGNSKEHLKLIRQLPSCVSGKRPCDSHHLKIKQERGMGMRSRDKWAVPLTRDEHDHLEAQGSRNELAWFKKNGIENPYELASALWKASPNLETMTNIIHAHIEAGRSLLNGGKNEA